MTDQMQGYETTFTGLFRQQTGMEEQPLDPVTCIEIPLIQRDYAQGRSSAQGTRRLFLEALRRAVVGDGPQSLDFVFGDDTHGVFRPLDGQQRLTTLFLLHWYLANRAGLPVKGEGWVKFSYATRPSARRFIEQLTQATPPDDVINLDTWIVNQPWYLYVWRHDPTIQSMLVMLQEIHRLFADVDAATAWERLTHEDNPAVSFYLLRLKEVGEGDEMYIKMNSRGKPLTEFENFKARFGDIIKWSPRARAIAHKFDTVWTDVMWRFVGDDNVVDDEFVRYLRFLFECRAWILKGSNGSDVDEPPVGSERLEVVASRLFGESAPASRESLEFFEAAMDAWVGVDVQSYFSGLLQPPDEESAGSRVTLFMPEWLTGTNLFELALRNYGEVRSPSMRRMPLGLTLLLYAALLNRIQARDDFPKRLRVLRNVVEASANEIRVDSMGELLLDVTSYVGGGTLEDLAHFNTAQLNDERRKQEMLARHPEAVDAVHRLEDHRLLRGNLSAIELDPERIEARADAFQRVFDVSGAVPYLGLTGALLTAGDHFRRVNTSSFVFGSPVNDAPWRDLLTAPARTSIEETRPAWSGVLDAVSASNIPLDDVYASLTKPWLEERRAARHFDWRYYMVAYPTIRRGASGRFVTEHDEPEYTMCALKRTQLNSYYPDAILKAIHELAGLNDLHVSPPWFTGRRHVPRWMELRSSDIRIRNLNDALLVDVDEERRERARRIAPSATPLIDCPEGLRWEIPQVPQDEGQPVDTVDRVRLGADLVRALVAEFGYLTEAQELQVRAQALQPLMAERLRAEAVIGTRQWVAHTEPCTRVAFELFDGNVIELVALWREGGAVLQLKGYPAVGSPQWMYPEFSHVDMESAWDASDAQIVEEFVAGAKRLLALHPQS